MKNLIEKHAHGNSCSKYCVSQSINGHLVINGIARMSTLDDVIPTQTLTNKNKENGAILRRANETV